MSYTHEDLERLIDKWSAQARVFKKQGDSGIADGIWCCVDDLIDLIPPRINELRARGGLRSAATGG